MLAWAALSDARLAQGDRPGAAAALKASILLGPNEPPLTLYRGALGLKLWPELDEEGRRLAGGQLRLAWDENPKAVVALARSGGNAIPVMIAFQADPTRLAGLMKALADRR
jgi:hypothetical protein